MIDCHYYIHYPYFLLLEGYCVALVCFCAVWWQGVGTVVSGTTLRGHIKLGDTLLLGPDSTGQFQSIVIKSIHRKRMPVREVKAGQTASFALKKVLFPLALYTQCAIKKRAPKLLSITLAVINRF